MTAQSGSLVTLKVGDGGSPENFALAGGLRVTSFTHRNQPADSTNLSSGQWRALNDSAGIRSMSISGSGTFNDSAAEALVRGYALGSNVRNYQLAFGNGDVISGSFLIVSYQRSGSYGGAETFAIALASAGPITYTPG